MATASDTIEDKKLDEDLEAFFAQLKRARIPIGIVERQRIHALVARLFVERAVDSFAGLRPYLTPLLARHQQDVVEIKAIFDRLLPAKQHEDRGGGSGTPGGGSTSGAEPKTEFDWRVWFRKNLSLSLGFLRSGWSALLLVVWRLDRSRITVTLDTEESWRGVTTEIRRSSPALLVLRMKLLKTLRTEQTAAGRIMERRHVAYDFAPTIGGVGRGIGQNEQDRLDGRCLSRRRLSELSGFAQR